MKNLRRQKFGGICRIAICLSDMPGTNQLASLTQVRQFVTSKGTTIGLALLSLWCVNKFPPAQIFQFMLHGAHLKAPDAAFSTQLQFHAPCPDVLMLMDEWC